MIRRWNQQRQCRHDRVRCIHGDEINHVRGKRGFCLDCDLWLDELPMWCSVTGRPH